MQTDQTQNLFSSVGKIEGLQPNTLVSDIWKLVEEGLLYLRRKYKKLKPEKSLNSCLHDWLDCETHNRKGCAFRFIPEQPENLFSGNSRSIDFSVKPKNSNTIKLHNSYVKWDNRFFAFEVKILGLNEKNNTEYIVGKEKDKICGGIERIKKGLHIPELQFAGMVGYVQTETFEFWNTKLNETVNNLVTNNIDNWSHNDTFHNVNFNKNIAHLKSEHSRINLQNIKLLHIWVDLT